MVTMKLWFKASSIETLYRILRSPGGTAGEMVETMGSFAATETPDMSEASGANDNREIEKISKRLR
jgi:hypothetical protein